MIMDNNLLPENIVFYDYWLPLDKNDFRILAWVTYLGGSFHGNLTDLCKLFGITPQSSNREKISVAIQQLADQGFLTVKKFGRELNICLIPKGAEISLARCWVQPILQHKYRLANVSPENVLKTLLWIARDNAAHNMAPVTNQMICEDLKISPSTLGLAKNVLSKELGAISRKIITEKDSSGEYLTLGQRLDVSAFWYGS